ncbi:MAG: hypothetical protein JXM79_25295, partial [Sedimentisphaerales bacterium]|nr:hypothetical protein [Sedimentisphaerales bacterium]
MFDFYEQPWTLIGAAVLVLFGMFTLRSIFPEKRRGWQLLIPLFIVGIAFGLDGLVKTDLEKIDTILDKCIKAVKDEDFRAVESVLSERYSDSYHHSKKHLLDHFKRVLSEPLIANHKQTGRLVDIKETQATVILFTTLTFEKNSQIAQNFTSFIMTKTKLTLEKQPDGKWLLKRIEVLE